eukprot:3269311-Ditylum_brightwellii.AAC.1
MGILALYYLLNAMVAYQQTMLDQMLIIHVDNMTAVRTSNKDIAPGNSPNGKKGLIVKAEWVKAHQDNTESFDDLPIDAQMNCPVDQYVKIFQHDTPPQLLPTGSPLLFLSNKANMMINNRHITNNLEDTLLDNLPS